MERTSPSNVTRARPRNGPKFTEAWRWDKVGSCGAEEEQEDGEGKARITHERSPARLCPEDLCANRIDTLLCGTQPRCCKGNTSSRHPGKSRLLQHEAIKRPGYRESGTATCELQGKTR